MCVFKCGRVAVNVNGVDVQDNEFLPQSDMLRVIKASWPAIV